MEVVQLLLPCCCHAEPEKSQTYQKAEPRNKKVPKTESYVYFQVQLPELSPTPHIHFDEATMSWVFFNLQNEMQKQIFKTKISK